MPPARTKRAMGVHNLQSVTHHVEMMTQQASETLRHKHQRRAQREPARLRHTTWHSRI